MPKTQNISVIGRCVVKRNPLPKHDIGIKIGEEYNYEYIGPSASSARCIYKIYRSGKVKFLSKLHFKMYMAFI